MPTHGSFKIQITDIYPQIGAVFKKNRHLLLVSKIPVFKIKPTLIIYCRCRFKKSSRADRVLSTRSRPYPLARTARMQPPLVVSQLSLCISSRNSLFPSHSRLSLPLLPTHEHRWRGGTGRIRRHSSSQWRHSSSQWRVQRRLPSHRWRDQPDQAPLLKVVWPAASHGEGALGGLPTVWARWEASTAA